MSLKRAQRANEHGLPAAKADESLAVREVLSLRADWLPTLPVQSVLELEVQGVEGVVLIDLSAQPQRGSFRAREWLAMVLGAATERARGADMRAWVEKKRSWPLWRLSDDIAVHGRIFDDVPPWTVARVLDQLEAKLLRVHVLEERETHRSFGRICRGFVGE